MSDRIAILGCGGIAYYLWEHIARILHLQGDGELWLIDGDSIESKNLERQFFPGVVGMNKAMAVEKMAKERFPNLDTQVMVEFLNKTNIKLHKNTWLKSDTLVFMCVDNDATRVYLEEQCERINNLIVIDGGNGDVDGQAKLWLREGYKNTTPSLVELAPEIKWSKDVMPDLEHCLDKTASDPQTAIVNAAVAHAMHWLFLNQVIQRFDEGEAITVNEVRVDTVAGTSQVYMRAAVPV